MASIRAALAAPGPFDAGPERVATAMMTTDTRPKTAVRTLSGGARITGVAKGVGMLEPDMATMLAYLFTDAEVDAGTLDAALRAAVDETFNCLSIDTDTSTSDTVGLLANGAAGPVDAGEFAAALREVCRDLMLQQARDGEGATKLLRVTVDGARDRAQAKRVAKSVVNSPLVKTAVHGADPNWGRVVMAVGKNTDDTDIEPGKVSVRFGDIEVYPAEPGPDLLADLTAVMRRDDVAIGVSLGLGDAAVTVYGCDLSAGYVRINADYTS
jgi:glutamate N-acetyltransferase/amino-acid N-acetyltransferase